MKEKSRALHFFEQATQMIVQMGPERDLESEEHYQRDPDSNFAGIYMTIAAPFDLGIVEGIEELAVIALSKRYMKDGDFQRWMSYNRNALTSAKSQKLLDIFERAWQKAATQRAATE